MRLDRFQFIEDKAILVPKMFHVSMIISVATLCSVCGAISPAIKSCKDLPKVPVPNIKKFVNAGPFTYLLSTPTFHCSVKTFAFPASDSHYNGSAINIRGGTDAIVFDYDVTDNGLAANSTVCSTGITQPWYFTITNFEKCGSYYCIYACNGTAIQDYGCASTNGKLPKKVLDVVAKNNGIEGADKVGPSQENCPPKKGCKIF